MKLKINQYWIYRELKKKITTTKPKTTETRLRDQTIFSKWTKLKFEENPDIEKIIDNLSGYKDDIWMNSIEKGNHRVCLSI